MRSVHLRLIPCREEQTSSADELRYVMFCQKRHKSELLHHTSDSELQHASLHLEKCFGSKTTPTLLRRKWLGKDQRYLVQPCYMTKAAAPNSLLERTTCKCRSGCQSNCSCVNLGLSCTEACFSMANVDLCKNPHGAFLDASDESEDDSDSEAD